MPNMTEVEEYDDVYSCITCDWLRRNDYMRCCFSVKKGGKLTVGKVRALLSQYESKNKKDLRIGQLKGITKDGTIVVDVNCGILFADENGLNYSHKDVKDVKVIEYLSDSHVIATCGSKGCNIIVSDGSTQLFS